MSVIKQTIYFKRPMIMRKDVQTIAETFVNLEKAAQTKTGETYQRTHLVVQVRPELFLRGGIVFH